MPGELIVITYISGFFKMLLAVNEGELVSALCTRSQIATNKKSEKKNTKNVFVSPFALETMLLPNRVPNYNFPVEVTSPSMPFQSGNIKSFFFAFEWSRQL